METLVLILMILVCFNFMLKQTFNRWQVVVLIAGLCALFVGFAWPYAISQSKTQIASWLEDTALMLDTSVLLTVEVALQMSFCLLAIIMKTSDSIKPRTRWMFRLLEWFPGLLIFPVLFSLSVVTIFALPGVSFQLVAWGTACALLASIILGTWLLKWLLPEYELRLELLFLCNALIGLLGIVATVNGRTAVAGTSEVDWGALGGLAGILLAGAGIGLLFRRYRLRRLQKE